MTAGQSAKAPALSTHLLRHVRREFSDLANALALYRMASLSAKAPQSLTQFPQALSRADKANGASILSGRVSLVGETLEINPGECLWDMPAPSQRYAEHLHQFMWLSDLFALEDRDARDQALVLLDDWIERFGKWNWFSWEPKRLHTRLYAWMVNGAHVFEGDGASARISCAVRQTRRLARTLSLMQPDRDQLEAAITLAAACLVFKLPGVQAQKAGQALVDALNQQILADGGHASRNPQAAADLLIRLCELDDLATRLDSALPEDVRRAMDRLSGFVRFARLPSGAMSGFHGGGEGDTRALSAAFAHLDLSKKETAPPFNVAPHSGYHRAEAAGSIVMFDAADPADAPHSADAHASPLAFEFTAPGGRVVVNCAWHHDQPSQWREAVRATPAHSVLTLEETSAAKWDDQGWRAQMLGAQYEPGSTVVKMRRNEEDVGIWLEASHDGYRAPFGMSLRRRIFLAVDGGDLRGEDGLFRPVEDGAPDNPDQALRFAIRFHLHPDVRASLSRDSLSALLVLPNGDGWRFRTDGGPVLLERSVYLGAGAPPQRATQLVINGEAEPYGGGDRPPNRIRWAFQRLGRIGAAG